jgi:acetyl esterase
MPIHPQCKAFLAALREAKRPAWNEMPLEEARQTFNELPVFGERVAVDNVADDTIAGVPVRIYHVHRSQPRDVIVYFHGGGWVLGGIESHDALCRRLAKAADATVVNVGYRNPPESPFPAAAEDCFTVCDVLGLDHAAYSVTDRIAVVGDSAGGNLAVSVALMARQRGGPQLAGQVLIYPVLDGTMASESYQQFATDHGLTAEVMSWFWEMYTGAGPSSSRHDPLASPAAADDLHGLPPTHLLLAEYDVLRDEGRTFADRLSAAGVPTTVKQYDGMLHGFVHFAELFDDAAVATQQVAERCRQFFADPPL